MMAESPVITTVTNKDIFSFEEETTSSSVNVSINLAVEIDSEINNINVKVIDNAILTSSPINYNEENLVKRYAVDKYVIKTSKVWHDIFKKSALSKSGVVIEIAPGEVPKIGIGLAMYGFEGTIYIVEPEKSSLDKVSRRYKQMMPKAKVVLIHSTLKDGVINLPNFSDMVVSNHPLDDMIIGQSLSNNEFKDFFTDHYTAEAEASRDLWKMLTSNTEKLNSSMDMVTDDWLYLILHKKPKHVVISQYQSHFLKKNKILDPDIYAQKVLNNIKALVKTNKYNAFNVQHSFIEKPESWLWISNPSERSSFEVDNDNMKILGESFLFDSVSSPTGGIDFNPNNLNIETQGKGMAYNAPIDPQLLESLTSSPIDGFSPVILNIVPIMNLNLFLGLSDNDESDGTEERISFRRGVFFKEPEIKESEWGLC